MKILKASIPSVVLITIIALFIGAENRELFCQGVYDVLTLQATDINMDTKGIAYNVAAIITVMVGIAGGIFAGMTIVALMCSLTYKLYNGDLDEYFPKLW